MASSVILLKTLNMTPAEIRKAVIAMDEFLLPRHVLDQLLKFVPTDEEVSCWCISAEVRHCSLAHTPPRVRHVTCRTPRSR